MRPEFIDAMSWEMAEVYGAVTDQILINLAKYFPYYDSSTFPRSSLTYQADMLAQMGQVNKETMAIIRRNLKNADPVLQRSLEQIIIDSVEAVNPELWYAVKKGIFMPPMTPVVSANQYRAFNLYYKQAADKLNLVNTVMLESTQDAYRATVSDIASRIQATQTALDIGAGETITGASAWNTATAHAINRMKQNGITGFIDHAGRRWSAESYVAMDIRTTMFNTGRAAVWETNQNFGNDLYQVSYHNGARPLCYPWQNKVISSTDTARTVTDLDGNEIDVIAQSATSYGKAAGLFGVNCKHYPNPFIPGVSVIRGEPQDKKTNDRVYEESQQQRAYERKIREEKRDLMMLKARGAPDDIIKAQRAKIRQTDDDIDEFCAKTGRHRRQNREGVYTERKFPSAFTYDPRLFEEKQKQLIDDYFKSGGAQQGFTFGQMTPKATTPPVPPITPTAPATPTAQPAINPDVATFNPAKTTEEAAEYAQTHFGNKYSKMSYEGIDVEYANTFNRVLTEANDKYDFSSIKGVQPMNLRSKAFRGTTAEAAYDWGGDGTLYINPKFYKTRRIFAKHKEEIDKLQETCIESGENFLKLGKYTGIRKTWLETLLRTKRQCVAQSYDFVEGTFVHETGHMLEDKVFYKAYDDYFGTKGIFEGKGKYLSQSMEKYGGGISAYAVTSTREYIAESFAAWWYGEISILDPKIVEVFEGTMRK